MEWLGVSGYRISYQGCTLFVAAALDRFLRAPGETVGVLVGHTHFDHAVDAPTHYDNFFRPLGGEMEFVANVLLAELPKEILIRRPPRFMPRRKAT